MEGLPGLEGAAGVTGGPPRGQTVALPPTPRTPILMFLSPPPPALPPGTLVAWDGGGGGAALSSRSAGLDAVRQSCPLHSQAPHTASFTFRRPPAPMTSRYGSHRLCPHPGPAWAFITESS